MAETIEAFVEKLQADGVQAGREAADKLRAEATVEAKRIVEEAEAKAKKIVEDAELEGEKRRSRTETDLKLAARDAIARLQDTLSKALKGLLEEATRQELSDAEFIKTLLHEIVGRYVQADIEAGETVVLNVPEEMREKLVHWAIQEFHKSVKTPKTTIDLQGTLSSAGFEYKIQEGTIEITVESAVELLCEMVGPELRKIVASAAADA